MAWEGSWVGTGCRWIWESSWQAALLVVLVLIAQRLFGRQLSPKWRYGLWLVVLVRLVVPNLPESRWSCFNLTRSIPAPTAFRATLDSSSVPESATPGARRTTALASDSPIQDLARPAARPSQPPAVVPLARSQPRTPNLEPRPFLDRTRFKSLLPILWAGGVAAVWLWILLRLILFWWNVRRSSTPTAQALLELLDRCRQEILLKTPVRLVQTDAVSSPAICGLLRPTLLLPARAAQCLTPAQLRLVFLHELAHCQRGDLRVNALVSVLQGLHWFNPVLWYAGMRIRGDMEMACDAHVLARIPPAQSLAYGEAILRCLEVWSAARPAGALGVVDLKRFLKRRLWLIANPGARRSLGWVVCLVLAALTITGLTNARSAAPQPLPTPQVLSPAEPVQPQELERERHLQIATNPLVAGTVQTFDGKPVKAAEVSLLKATIEGGSRRVMQETDLKTLTDGQGRWRLTLSQELIAGGVAALTRGSTNSYSYLDGLRVTHPDFAPAVHFLGFTPVTKLALRLAPYRTVQGQVFDRDNRLIQNAQLEATVTGYSNFKTNLVTGSEGRFIISGIPPEYPYALPGQIGGPTPEIIGSSLTIVITAPEQAVYAVQLPVNGPTNEILTVHLDKPCELTGRVLDPEGRPVGGAKVKLPPFPVELTTDTNGIFFWAAAPPQPVGFKVEKEGYAANTGTLQAGSGVQVITLQPWCPLIVDVVDVSTGLPLSGINYYLSSGGEGHGLPSPLRLWPKEADFPYDLRVRVEAPGYESTTWERTLETEHDRDHGIRVRMALKSAKWLEGQVLLPDGRPAAGATVRCLLDTISSESAGFIRALHAQDEAGFYGEYTTAAGQDGRFSLPPIPSELPEPGLGQGSVLASVQRSLGEGKAYLVAESPLGYAALPVDEVTENQKLVLLPRGSLTGRLGAGRLDTTSATLFLRPRPDLSAQKAVLRSKILGPTDNQGRFGVSELPAGSYDVVFPALGDFTTNITIRAGEATHLDLFPEARRIRGKLAWAGTGEVDWVRGVLKQPSQEEGTRLGTFEGLNHRWPQGLVAKNGDYLWTLDPEWQCQRGCIPMRVSQDGSFTVPTVLPGPYELCFIVTEPSSQLRASLRPNDKPSTGGRHLRFPAQPETLLGRAERWIERNGGYRGRYSSPPVTRFDLPDFPTNAFGSIAFTVMGVPAALVRKEIYVPAATGDRADDWHEVETLTLTDLRRTKLEDPAPLISGQEASGRSSRLCPVRGKWRVICFWRSDSDMSRSELPLLKALEVAVADPSRFEVILVSLDDNPSSVRKPEPWMKFPSTVVWGGPWSTSEVVKAYGVTALPDIFLVDPDGKIAGRHLRGFDIVSAVELALATK